MREAANADARHGCADGESRQPTHLQGAHARGNGTVRGWFGVSPSAGVGVASKAHRGGV